MDILKILDESINDLYPEDLEFFETELDTGEGYDEAYQQACREKIQKVRAWMNGSITSPKDPLPPEPEKKAEKKRKGNPSGLIVSITNLAPDEANPLASGMSPEKLIFSEIEAIRKDKVYKTRFKDYVEHNPKIDSEFVDAHHSFFEPWELDAVVSVKQMGEEFLEKYFGALDHDKIARYQVFSEAFFMKHWPDLDPDIVLNQGRNEWRKKEKRSKQLDVFLRLKGVKK